MKSDPRWKMVERVVAALERGLTPAARVQHNVRLPVLGRPNREPRQCDVVITSGNPPRQTLTIVEVQARADRPHINMLPGWIEKMREVGAQHLICVSEAGFPQSIISDVALKYGPTVRLMTLQELESPSFPGFILAPTLLHKVPKFEIASTGALASSCSQSLHNSPS